MRRVDDRELPWKGKRAHSVFPEEVRHSTIKHVEGAGRLTEYPDTEELVARDQEGGIRHAEGRKMKPGYRN